MVIRSLRLLTLLVFICATLNAFEISLVVKDANGTEVIDGKNVPVVSTQTPFDIHVVLNGADRSTQQVDFNGQHAIDILNRQQSMSVTSINGKTTSKTTIILHVQAKREGVFTIGPSRVRHDNQTYESNVLTIKATKNSVTPKNSEGAATLRCTLTAETLTPVVGQPVIVKAKLHVQGSVADMGMTPLKADNCLVKEINQASASHETIDGKNWDVIEKKYVVTPTKEGPLTINGVTATVAVPAQRRHGNGWPHDFFNAAFGMGLEQKQATSEDLVFTVIPLPKYEKSVQGIGKFSGFYASLNTHEAVVGEPIILTLTVDGKANLDALATPKLNIPSTFKYYDSKNSTHQNLTSDFNEGKKIFEFIVQANTAGQFEIPSQSFTFYDHTQQTYKTLTTDTLQVIIKPSTSPVTNPLQQDPEPQEHEADAEQPKASSDISFICEEYDKDSTWALPWWLFAIISFVPCIFLFSPTLYTRLRTIQFGSTKSRSKKTESTFLKQLKSLIESNATKHIYPFFLKFLAHQNATDISQVTEDWIESHLIQRGWDHKKVSDFISYLATCAQQNFTHTGHNSSASDTLLKKAHYWFLMLTQ